MRTIDPKKLAELQTANQTLDEKYGKLDSPSRKVGFTFTRAVQRRISCVVLWQYASLTYKDTSKPIRSCRAGIFGKSLLYGRNDVFLRWLFRRTAAKFKFLRIWKLGISFPMIK